MSGYLIRAQARTSAASKINLNPQFDLRSSALFQVDLVSYTTSTVRKLGFSENFLWMLPHFYDQNRTFRT